MVDSLPKADLERETIAPDADILTGEDEGEMVDERALAAASAATAAGGCLVLNSLTESHPIDKRVGDSSIKLLESNEAINEAKFENEKLSVRTSEQAANLKKTKSKDNSVLSPPRTKDGSCYAPDILSLPMDALHNIASFLKPVEWCGFALVNRASHRVYREIIRRVYMHGFKCATEIVTAWKMGQHEDAKELAALYISEGVPIYPRSLGHSYYTLLWKMQTEIREQDEATQSNSPGSTSFKVDAFYDGRGEFRSIYGGLCPDMTYLEMKSLFWMHKENEQAEPQARNFSSARRETAPMQELVESRIIGGSDSAKDFPVRKKKLHLNVHRHLLDQHHFSRCYVDDRDGTMLTPSVSLSADFYHSQQMRRRYSRERFRSNSDSGTVAGVNFVATEAIDLVPLVAEENNHPPRFGEAFMAVRRFQNQIPFDDDLFEPQLQQSPFKNHPVLDFLDLEVYSVASSALDSSSKAIERPWQMRFESYHRKLEAFLSRGDNYSFEETMLDFWDEVFPHTAGIHYHDRHTAVPRISSLQDFLTKPCPKAIGIVQCEIERIKTTAKGKGVNVKGRLFPTYEYRLFIRNRPHDFLSESAVLEDDEDFIRRDTVLMVAKNRGRRFSESPGIISISSPKKGSNNYFLHMPSQCDVDAHFSKVNGDQRLARLTPNGASHACVLSSNEALPALLGRLQSNFIGTEFQIFTPRVRKHHPRKASPSSYRSDEDVEYDSCLSSDTNSARRSRFGRLSLRRSSTSADVLADDLRNRGQLPRAVSSPDVMLQGRQGWSKRRAIANTPDTQKQQEQQEESVLCEEEDGVITYTANLLGSRPRIMDVCIPKVSADGTAGEEWKIHIDGSGDGDDSDMLSTFRQILQRLENQEENLALDNASPEADGNVESVEDCGLLILQNRPPWWNMELGSFVLNFGGRVSVASVKNFQLCDRNDQDRILLQFGRIQGRHSFTMDFQHPLTAVQAFSIAISSLQSKISFG